MLIVSGGKDHVAPAAISKAAYQRQRRNIGVTELVEFPDRGHSLTFDSGWREVADATLAFLDRQGIHAR